MRGMPYDLQLQGNNGLVEVAGFPSESKCKKIEGSCASNEPISVLDTRRSPSPSTSTSTLSSSFGGGNGGGGGGGSVPPEMGSGSVSVTNLAAASGGGRKDEWAAELQPILAGLEPQRFGLGLDDWESLLSESAASPGQDQSLLRWISGDVEDTSFSLKQLLQGGSNPNEHDENAPVGDIDHSSIFETSAPAGNVVPSFSPPLALPGSVSSLNNNENFASGPNFNPQNPNFFNQQPILNQITPTHNTFPQFSDQFQPQPKRHNPGFSKAPFFYPGHEFTPRKQQQLQLPQLGLANHLQQKPLMVAKQETAAAGGEQIAAPPHHHNHNQQQQVICDQLCSAAELILAGNFSHAQGILARLNHQLSPMAKPFQRAAFYFKEALQIPLLMSNPHTSLPPRIPTPLNGMFKMGAYKVLAEMSPLIQFMNFTSNQTLLETLEDAENIHILDFDIGFGAQWASFMQELPRRNNGVSSSLKITAFASPSTHHPIELGLMHENLSHFAHEIGISFELEVVNFDSFDPSSFSLPGDEAIAVNFPVWSFSTCLSAVPSLLRFIKQLSPRIVVSLDRGCERTDLPFSQYLLHGLQYYEVLLDSIDAANVTSDIAIKIERFLFQPMIENMVLGRLYVPEQMPHWKTLFTSLGYSPAAISNFAETQAECVVKRSQIRGFRVDKRQASLVLCWQQRVLMSASAWKC